MKFILTFLIYLLPSILQAQNYSEQHKLDSIINEADLLYNYEKVIWVATDALFINPNRKKDYGGYLVYHSNDTITVSFIHRNQKECIAQFSYRIGDLVLPINETYTKATLSSIETKLLKVKSKMSDQLRNPEYDIRVPERFNPNLVLIPAGDTYKLYVIMGATENGVIPFGNDYLFIGNKAGVIGDWKKFHSSFIPVHSVSSDGRKVESSSHSHLKGTPYITATDICTFRLYAKYCGQKEFKVLCTATDKIYTYNLDKNKISIEDAE